MFPVLAAQCLLKTVFYQLLANIFKRICPTVESFDYDPQATETVAAMMTAAKDN